jgi:peptide/nickel transport system substrate-binding protein
MDMVGRTELVALERATRSLSAGSAHTGRGERHNRAVETFDMKKSLQFPRRTVLATALGSAAAGSFGPSWLRSAMAQAIGKTLSVAIPNNPTTLDPINQVYHDPMVIQQSIFENLVEYDVDGVLRPQLATQLPEISADKLVYTFDLRDDVAFHDGQQMTADDVKYSFESMLDEKRNAVRRSLFVRIERVDVDSPTRVRIRLKEPYSPWTAFLTKYMGIWPKGSREKLGDEHFKLHPTGVGTGPFMFEEWRPNEYVSLKRNPNYRQKDIPHWERLVVKIVPEDAARVAYLLTGQADIIGAPPARDFQRLKQQKGLAGGSRLCLGGWTAMLTNILRPPFDDINFRKAVAYAIDRKSIAKDVFFGLLEPATVPAPPGSWWYDEKADTIIDYNLDKAKEYLKKSKYPDGAEFEMSLPSTPYLLDMKDAAVVIQSQLEKLNIRPRLKMGEVAVVFGEAMRGEGHSILMNVVSPGEPTFLITQYFQRAGSTAKVDNYTNPQIDELLNAAYGENEQEKLKPIYASLMRLLAEESPVIWLGFFYSANLWRDSVKNFKVNQGLSMVVRDTVPG